MAKRRSPTSGPPPAARLPDAEMEVLSCLWQLGEATARQVREAMAHYRPMAHGSTLTLLNRLQAKGIVKRVKAPTGKAFIYRPTSRPGPTYRRVVGRLLDRVFGGDGVTLVASLFAARPPSPQQVEELQALLDNLRGKDAPRKDAP